MAKKINITSLINDENESAFIFWMENEWLIKITDDPKIIFNTKKFPNLMPNDFAKKFIEILFNETYIYDYFKKKVTN